MKKNLKNILGGDAFWMVNKALARYIKDLQSVVLLSYLIDKEDYHRQRNELMSFEDENEDNLYFYATAEKIEHETTLSYKQQKRCLKILKDHKLISDKLTGMPARLHFTLHEENISDILLGVKHDLPKGKNKNTPKVKPSIDQREEQELTFGHDILITDNKEHTINNKTTKDRQNKFDPSQNGFEKDFKTPIEVNGEERLKINLNENQIQLHMKIIIDRLPEANIQAEFYHRCRLEKIKCILEYKVDNCRFDALVYDNQKNVVCIVEFKSYKTRKTPKRNTNQMNKYRKYDLPILLITRFEDVGLFIEKAKKLLSVKAKIKTESWTKKWSEIFNACFQEVENTKDNYQFQKRDYGDFGRIKKMLVNLYKGRNEGQEPTDETINNSFEWLCKKAARMPWLKENYRPANFTGQFNKIINAKTEKEKNMQWLVDIVNEDEHDERRFRKIVEMMK